MRVTHCRGDVVKRTQLKVGRGVRQHHWGGGIGNDREITTVPGACLFLCLGMMEYEIAVALSACGSAIRMATCGRGDADVGIAYRTVAMSSQCQKKYHKYTFINGRKD